MSKITIAIDGFSSTGKSTIAKQLAKELKYVYVDSGAMYRAVTLFAMQQELISDELFLKNDLINDLNKIDLCFEFNETLGIGEIYLNGTKVENEIRSLDVSSYVSRVAEVSEVRSKLVQIQRELGVKSGVVMDGRDIGTVVFPKAELKLFMTASADKRAKRRYDELLSKGDEVSYSDVYDNVVQRDLIDTTREDSPLVKAEDAIEIDNSNLSREEQFEVVLQLALDKL